MKKRSGHSESIASSTKPGKRPSGLPKNDLMNTLVKAASRLGLTLALIAAPEVSAEGETEPDLETKLEQLMKEGNVPGLEAAVLVDGEIVWIRALGTADLENDRPMTTKSILNIGSVSKLVTATAALLLWEEGKIDLDADINQYLPFQFKHPSGNPITVRQLLSHSSGLQES